MPPHTFPPYERLRQTIAERMRMSHIYQPLMLMELLDRRNPAPAQDIARRILGEDVTQIEYYTERVKRMVGRVLTGNGITRHGERLYTLFCLRVEDGHCIPSRLTRNWMRCTKGAGRLPWIIPQTC
jgi:ATP adenylyltransferase